MQGTMNTKKDKNIFPSAIRIGPFRKRCSIFPQLLSSETKRPGGEADHSFPFSAQFKYTLSCGVQEQLYVYFTSVVVT